VEVISRPEPRLRVGVGQTQLHGGLPLQAAFTTLASYTREGVLFATHSIGVARAAADWIYAIRKAQGHGNEVTPLEASSRLWELLGEMSFSGSRELGFRRVLLVEGPTEIKTMQQFLRQLEKDHLVVLLPLGGKSMIDGSREAELAEMKRICDDVRVLIDSERAVPEAPLEPNRQVFVGLCARLSIPCHVLERRATENYLSDRAVKKVWRERCRALGPHELLRTLPLAWSKAETGASRGRCRSPSWRGRTWGRSWRRCKAKTMQRHRFPGACYAAGGRLALAAVPLG
jgi:hypothetical protein